jgi:hypothetical protein
LIKIQNILTLAVIISLILPLQYNPLKFANGQMNTDSQLVMYDDKNSKNPFLADSNNTILKPKIDVSIEGTPNNDQMKGGDGEDKISGEDGDDTLSGGKGTDKINGGKGDDIINGEVGSDTLKGENGDDKISGESENDLLEGEKGNDMLLAGEGDDGILGGEGNDVLDGGEGTDMMAGGIGNDTFICDLFDTIIDFNSNQGDKIIGQCSPEDQVEDAASSDIIPQENFQPGPPPSSQFNHNIPAEDFQPGPPPQQSFNSNNIPMEEHKLPPPGPPPQQSFNSNNIPMEEHKLPPPGPPPRPHSQSLPPFSIDDLPPEDFRSFPPFSVPPSNEKYMSGPFFN